MGGVEGWRAASLVEGHNHKLEYDGEEEEEEVFLPRARGKKRRRTPAPSSDSGSDDEARPSPSPPLAIRRRILPTNSSDQANSIRASASRQRIASQPIASTSRALPPTPAFLPPPPPQQPNPTTTTHLFLSSLTSFLHHLSPSLARSAPRLLGAGVRSTDSLLALLALDEAQLTRFLGDEELGLPTIAQVILQKKLREKGREALGGKCLLGARSLV